MEKKMIKVETNSGIVANSVGTISINPLKIKKSVIAILLQELICNKIFSSPENEKEPIAYDVINKISYNNIIKYKELINQNATFYAICENVINSLDDLNSGVKTIILQSVRSKYITIKGDLLRLYVEKGLSELDIVKKHSDDILDKTFGYYDEQSLLYTTLENYSAEDVTLNMQAFITYCS